MALIRDPSDPTRILKVNADGSINVVAVLTELEVKNDSGNPLNVTDPAFGTAGGTTAPPNGTGTLGWLRGIYDKLVAGIAVTGTQTDALTNTQLRASAVPVSGTVTAAVNNFPATQAVSGSVNIGNSPTVSVSNFPTPQTNALTNTELRATAVPVSGPLTDTQLRASAIPFSLSGIGTAVGTPIFSQEVVSGAAISPSNPLPTRNVPADLAVQAQSAAAAAVTLTIPAAGAGLFHYIDVIEITLYATAARTGAAAPVTITSTNLPAALSWLLPTAQAIGAIDRQAYTGDRPLRSAAANTATTIVAPAVTGGIVQIKVAYSVGP